jgi:PEP-CTERM motif
MKTTVNNPFKLSLAPIVALVSSVFLAQLGAQSLSITGVISQTVGSTADIPTSGSTDNTVSYFNGTAGVFEINNGAYYMRVNTSNNGGTLAVGEDSLMVARTVNSQGLMDDGSLSIFILPNPNNATTQAQANLTAWNLDVNFSFFSDAALTIPATINNFTLTSLDIDFGQRYYTQNSDFTANNTYSIGLPTNLVAAPAVSGYTGFTTPGNNDSSIFNESRNAVSSVGNGSSFDIRLDHRARDSGLGYFNSANALYMFEFRNPSSIVPEPSSALLALGGLSVLGLMRRRNGH